VCLVLLGASGSAAEASRLHIKSGHKARVEGSIVSRQGDLVNVWDQSAGALVVIEITDHTKIDRTKKGFAFRHADVDVTALVPGLSVDAEGVGNAQGQLEAVRIRFNPDEFGSTSHQIASNPTESPADRPLSATRAPGALGFTDASAMGQASNRVSDLGGYENVVSAGIYFAAGKTALDAAATKCLDRIADVARPLPGYLIEVAGYASGTGSKQLDESLSAARAEAVAQYLRDHRGIPIRRILAPPGYIVTPPDYDSEAPAPNRRIEVTVLVNDTRH
jgi:outer membrane protein OmpA-like peptidoglycan-associated protein